MADGISENAYEMFLALSAACRLLFRPRFLSQEDLSTIDKELKSFCLHFDSVVYRGSWERTPVCRSTIVSLLSIVPPLRTCGPALVYWPFPMEGYIGTLPKLMRSSSKPYESLVKAVACPYKPELITSFAELQTPGQWVEATGIPSNSDNSIPSGTYSMDNEADSILALLPPRTKASFLVRGELSDMRTVLALPGRSQVPSTVYAKKYSRLRLDNGDVA